MRKKILTMSIAAILTAMTSSGVMAFDSVGLNDGCSADLIDNNENNDIIVYQGPLHELKAPHRLAAYRTPLKPANSDLELEPEGRGDALVYPLYKAKDGWKSDIIVRNTDSEHAIVAKVSLRRKTDSLEVFDFNIYLSADDVARFTIQEHEKGGIEIYSEDGSILRKFPSPSSNSNDVTKDHFASKDKPFIANEDTIVKDGIKNSDALVKIRDAGAGYVVIFGMGEAKGKVDNKGEDRYHDDHARLFANYRKELDVCRKPWRVGHQRAMLHGTYIRNTIISVNDNGTLDDPSDDVYNYSDDVNFSIPAPNQAEDCIVNGGAVAGNYFGDVNKDYKNGLTGTVRLYTGKDGARDMILPAVAIKNFTDGNKIIYTEGEIAALQDRRIFPTIGGIPTIPPYHVVPPNAINASTVTNSRDKDGEILSFLLPGTNLNDDADDINDATNANNGGLQAAQTATWHWAEYWEPGICKDATAFHVSRTTYTFEEDSVGNQLIVTQPYKRILVQMGNDDRYWQNVILPAYKPPVYHYDNDGKLVLDDLGHFGGFSYVYNVYDEHEKMIDVDYTQSPYNAFNRIIRPELAVLRDLEKGTEFEGKNGFARLWFTNEAGYRAPIPAIITQMIGTTIDTGAAGSPNLVPQVNWIYSQFRKTVD